MILPLTQSPQPQELTIALALLPNIQSAFEAIRFFLCNIPKTWPSLHMSISFTLEPHRLSPSQLPWLPVGQLSHSLYILQPEATWRSFSSCPFLVQGSVHALLNPTSVPHTWNDFPLCKPNILLSARSSMKFLLGRYQPNPLPRWSLISSAIISGSRSLTLALLQLKGSSCRDHHNGGWAAKASPCLLNWTEFTAALPKFNLNYIKIEGT